MSKRENYSTGAPWEEKVGYSRAVKSNKVIEISGTIALDAEGNSTGINDPYQQTIEIVRIAQRVLEEAGSSLNDVGRAHGEFFREIRPATSMVEIEFTAHLI